MAHIIMDYTLGSFSLRRAESTGDGPAREGPHPVRGLGIRLRPGRAWARARQSPRLRLLAPERDPLSGRFSEQVCPPWARSAVRVVAEAHLL